MFETTKPGVLLKMRAKPGEGDALATFITDLHHVETNGEIEKRHEEVVELPAEPPVRVMVHPVASS